MQQLPVNNLIFPLFFSLIAQLYASALFHSFLFHTDQRLEFAEVLFDKRQGTIFDWDVR